MATRVFDFIGAEGQRLSGRLETPDGPVCAYALFAHCFTCTKDSLAAVRIARALTDRGIGVLRFDFTGLGQSGGDFADSSFSGSIRDLLAAARAMSEAGVAPGLLIGHSLGGAAVLAAAADLPDVRAIATIGAPFDAVHVTHLLGDGLGRLEAEGEAEISIGGRPFILRKSFVDDLSAHDQAARIRALKRPLLILHSPQDQTVAIDNASSIFMAARHPKSFVSLDGADHLLSRADDATYAAGVIAAWASRHFNSDTPPRSAAQTGDVIVEETGVHDFQVEVHAGGAHFIADEPVEVGGGGSGPTPYDLLCAALGACTAMTLRMYARGKDLPLKKVRVTVGHHRESEPEPLDVFTREIDLEGDLTDAMRARLLEIAERCPVHRTLERSARIVTGSTAASGSLAAESPVQHGLDVSAVVSGEAG